MLFFLGRYKWEWIRKEARKEDNKQVTKHNASKQASMQASMQVSGHWSIQVLTTYT